MKEENMFILLVAQSLDLLYSLNKFFDKVLQLQWKCKGSPFFPLLSPPNPLSLL